MSGARPLLAALLLAAAWREDARGISPPSYTADSIVNAASNRPGALSPNAIGTVYGADLSYSTRSVRPEDVGAGSLPSVLDGVRVRIGGIYASLLYVSPGQINFVVPCVLIEGDTDFFVERDNTRGEKVPVRLLVASPAMFALDPGTVIATSAEGKLLTAEAPAAPGDVVVLYGTGLGATIPDQVLGRTATSAARIRMFDDLRVVAAGEVLPQENILYAGVTPGFAGLYQINLRLPQNASENPEIRVWILDQVSQPDLRLPLRPRAAVAAR
jgi:uncharacterized protein (TIGR03437 family)